jgi:hypothetical protein
MITNGQRERRAEGAVAWLSKNELLTLYVSRETKAPVASRAAGALINLSGLLE